MIDDRVERVIALETTPRTPPTGAPGPRRSGLSHNTGVYGAFGAHRTETFKLSAVPYSLRRCGIL